MADAHVSRLWHKTGATGEDPKSRWQSAGDLASELKWIAEAAASPMRAQPLARDLSLKRA